MAIKAVFNVSIIVFGMACLILSMPSYARDTANAKQGIIAVKSDRHEDADFRRTKWGMTKAVVKRNESLDLAEEDENLMIYKTKLLGNEYLLGYIFVNGKLVRAKYVLAQSFVNKNTYLSVFDSLVRALAKKYGTPIKENDFWSDDLYRKDYNRWGMAVATGRLTKIAQWETDRTTITALCRGENFKISVGVEYSGKSVAFLEKEKRRKDLMDNL